MLTEILSLGDTIIRIPFWFIFELIISSRIDGLSQFIMRQPKSVASLCPDCPGVIEERHVPIFIAYIAILCLIAMLCHSMGVFTVHLLIVGTILALTCSMIYVLLLRFAYAPWEHIDMDPITEVYLGSSFSLSLIILLVMSMLAYPQRVPNKRWFLVSALAAAVPVVCYLPARYLMKTGPLSYDCQFPQMYRSSVACSSPAWYSYGLVLLRPRHCQTTELPYDLCVLVEPSHGLRYRVPVCPAALALRCSSSYCDPRIREMVYTLARFSVPVLNMLLLILCVKLTKVIPRVRSMITEQLEFYRMIGILEFISHHWNRLNLPRTMALLWISKVFMVILFGPDHWPIFPTGNKDINSPISNISFLQRYISEDQNQTTLSMILTRASVGALVHGSESWLIVFGAASFFGVVAILVVQILVRLVDPGGKQLERLYVTAREAPVDLLEWSVIEDPALAMDQNDLLAVEMLSGTGWNSAVVFLFLAFQYDLPSLPISQRISCCLYGMTVIAITCVHPVQALIKSLLLRLDAPGRQNSSTWFDHIRPLMFCFGLIGAAFCIITYAPEQLVAANATPESTASSTTLSTPLVPRFGSSVESLKARQMRIVLCGCQLLLGLIVTLIEYVIHQISHRIPDWSGFRPSLFWTKLISSVLDYMISLLSFLTVCWLSVYDSIGVCRMFIICCYFYFILYPSAVRAYTWVRWKLLFRQRIHSLASPSEAELAVRGSTCPICYVDMTPESSRMTRCGHLYHIECLSRWMRRQLFCPICHADLLSTKVTDRRRVSGTQENGSPAQA